MLSVKMIQSFWSKPLDNLVSLRHTGGWLERKYYYMSLCFSCLLLRRYYDNVELVTDREGRRILIEELGLPYTSTRVDLEGLASWHSDLGLTAKLVSLQRQHQPAIYVENDIFLCDRLPPEVESGAFVAYSEVTFIPEELREFRGFIQQNMRARSLSAEEDLFEINSWLDMGLLGGSDIRVVSDFVKESLDFLLTDMEVIRSYILSDVRDTSYYLGEPHPFDVEIAMLESFLLASFASKHPGLVSTAFSAPVAGRGKSASFLEMSPKLTHLRVMYNRKKNIDVCMQLEFKFREQFPDYYNRLIDRMTEGSI